MKITKFLIIASFLMLSFDHAMAEEKTGSSMRYTTKGHKQEHANLKSIKYSNEDPKKAKSAQEQETTADKAWERYRALAAGKGELQDEPAAETKTVQETVPVPPKAAEPKLTGLAGLIQQYQENKEKRGGMRSITVTQPGTLKQKTLSNSERQPPNPSP